MCHLTMHIEPCAVAVYRISYVISRLKFNFWNHLVWMTLSHIAGRRDIVGLMSSLQGSINHLGEQQAPPLNPPLPTRINTDAGKYSGTPTTLSGNLWDRCSSKATIFQKYTGVSSFWMLTYFGHLCTRTYVRHKRYPPLTTNASPRKAYAHRRSCSTASGSAAVSHACIHADISR